MSQNSPYPLIQALLHYFNGLHLLSKGFIVEIEKNVLPIHIRKNKYLLSPVDHNRHAFFIVKGLVRGFIKDGSKDITTRFSFGNEFIGAIRNPAGEILPSIEYLQALEDCEIVAVPFALIDHLYEQYPETNVISRKIITMQYHAASERSILARIPMAQKRYDRFVQASSAHVGKIPLRCVASYLGMRLETLSRIRNKEITDENLA